MGARVLIYSESRKGSPVYGTLGARRWAVTTYDLKPSAERRRAADPDRYEHDRDADECEVHSAFPTFEQAIAVAKRQAPGSVYGSATVQEEVLDWYVEPRCADWEAVGPQFEVDSNGDVMKL